MQRKGDVFGLVDRDRRICPDWASLFRAPFERSVIEKKNPSIVLLEPRQPLQNHFTELLDFQFLITLIFHKA